VRPDEPERRLRARPKCPRSRSPRRTAPRPDAAGLRPGDAIGEYWGNPKTRTFAELLIDCQEDRRLRAVLVGMLREGEGR
jgi:hypothetical protein